MDIVSIYGITLFTAAVSTVKELVLEAIKNKVDLYGANLRGATLCEANLYGANLRGANLYGANLRGANLYGADLRGANLRGATLYGANLCESTLYGADLRGANLCEATLYGANLYGANLRESTLYGADLRGANLCEATLYGANLYGANLREANLCGANLYGANLRGATLYGAKNAEVAIARLQFIPEEGSFYGWKKCKDGIIVKINIPEDAKRSHGTERKCRAEKVLVIEVIGSDVGISIHDGKTEYRKGETVIADSFGEDRWETCAPGIHFYLTRIEAENHN